MTKPIRNMLVIDDNHADILLCKIVIERSGLIEKLTSFAYAEDALEHLLNIDARTVDAILLDINMPRMNGFEFLEAARDTLGADFTSIAVGVLTTSAAPSDVERAGRFAAVRHFFDKPLTEEQLRQLAQTVGKH